MRSRVVLRTGRMGVVLVTPCPFSPQTKERREASSRGSALTGRSRSSVTAVEARQVGLEPTTSRLTAGHVTDYAPEMVRNLIDGGHHQR